MKIGDLVKFKHGFKNGETFIIYKTYEDEKTSCYFLIGKEGKQGAFLERQLEVISEGR